MSSLRAFDNDAREDAAGSLDGLVPVKDGLGGLARRIVSASSACSSPPHELDEEEPWMEMVELVTPRSRTMAASLLLCPPSSWPPPHPPLPDHLPHARLGHPCSSSSCGAEEEGVGDGQEEGCVLAPGGEGCDRPGSRPHQRCHGCMLAPPVAATALTPLAAAAAMAPRSPPPWPPARRRHHGPPARRRRFIGTRSDSGQAGIG
jgi:hypothetical protein